MAEIRLFDSHLHLSDQAFEGRADLFDAFARLGTRGDDRSVFERPPRQRVTHVLLGELPHLLVDEILLRQDDEAAVDAEQRADREVFSCLGHDAFVRGDDEHHEIEP